MNLILIISLYGVKFNSEKLMKTLKLLIKI